MRAARDSTDRAFSYGLAVGIEASVTTNSFVNHNWLEAALAGVTAMLMLAVFWKLRRSTVTIDG